MEMNDGLLEYLEELSFLRLSSGERERVADDLGQIIDYMSKLRQLKAETQDEAGCPMLDFAALRPDKVTESADREQLLRNAPEQESGLFRAPIAVE